MAGRYTTKRQRFELAAAGVGTLTFGPETCPFENFVLWLTGAAVAWKVEYVDAAGNVLGTQVANGNYAGGAPVAAWTFDDAIPAHIRPRVTVTAGAAAVVEACWVALSRQPHG